MDYSLRRYVAEQCYLPAHLRRDILLCAQHQHIWLDTYLLKLLHRVLRRLGLQLFGCRDIGHIRQVYAQRIAPKLPPQLAHTLQVRQRLYVAYGAANLRNHKVKVARVAQILHIALYLIGDVGHYLHSLAQIVASTLFVYHALIDATSRHIVGAGGRHISKTLIVTQVKVCLMPVNSDIALSVLIRIEGARVNVDIGVKFLDCHAIASGFQQTCQRR